MAWVSKGNLQGPPADTSQFVQRSEVSTDPTAGSVVRRGADGSVNGWLFRAATQPPAAGTAVNVITFVMPA